MTFAVGDRVQVTRDAVFTDHKHSVWKIGIVERVLDTKEGEFLIVKWSGTPNDPDDGAVIESALFRHCPKNETIVI